MNETDQWLLDGDCNKCRRQSYCRKMCGALKRARRNAVKQALAVALEKRMKEKHAQEEGDTECQ